MKKIILFLSFVLVFLSLQVNAAKITSDELNLGKAGSAADKVIKLGPNRQIRSNETTGALEFSNDTGALWKKVGSGSGSASGGVNSIGNFNAGFEDGTVNWTNSGGTYTQESYTNADEGNAKYARFVASAAAQYLETDLVTVSDSLGFGCMADFKFKQTGSNFTYSIIDGTAAVISGPSTIQEQLTWYKVPTATFPCPTAGSTYKLRIESTASGTIEIDDAYLGSNKGFIPSIFKGETVEKILSANVTSIQDIADFTITGLDIGDRYELKGVMNVSALANLTYVNYRSGAGGTGTLYGTTNMNTNTQTTDSLHVSLEFTAASSTFYAYLSNVGGGGNIKGDGSKSESGSFLQLTKVSSKEVQAFTPEQADFFVSGKIQSTTSNTTGSPSASPVSFVSSTLEMTPEKGSSKIPCDSTNSSTGTTCSVGNETIGVVFNAPVAGSYRVCFQFKSFLGSGVSGIRINRTENSSQTIIKTGIAYNGHPTSDGQSNSLCEFFDIDSIGDVTARLMYTTDGTISIYDSVGVANSYDQNVSYSVELMQNNVARPVIQNMVDTHLGSGLRTEACRIQGISGTPTIDNESGICDWVDSVAANGTAVTIVTWKAGVFSGIPVCQITVNAPASGNVGCNLYEGAGGKTPSSSNAQVLCETDTTGAANNQDFSISCKGAK